MIGENIMNNFNWENKLNNWLTRTRIIQNVSKDDCIRFFNRAFENTFSPEKAWFGIVNNAVSLMIGGIYLAALTRSGDNKGIWLLTDDPPDIPGIKRENVLSTKSSTKPLEWFHANNFKLMEKILDNQILWQAYHRASLKIQDFPIASDRPNLNEKYKRKKLSEFYIQNVDIQEEIYEGLEYDLELSKTEQEAIVKVRKMQHKFRKEVHSKWGCCSVTSCQNSAMLQASHIKPWKNSKNRERLDPDNGLLLIPNLHIAFDAGLISFSDDGSIQISRSLSIEDQAILGIKPNLKIRTTDPELLKNLQYHRENIFEKNKD
jgi:hypothetical protein